MFFAQLHTHSEYSFLAGVPKIDDLVQKSKDLGYTALALTDTNRMSGLILFYQACRKFGLKSILGTELIRRTPAGAFPIHPTFRILILAKNLAGYKELCQVISLRQLHADNRWISFFKTPRPNLVIIACDLESLITLAKTPNKENLFAEVVNHGPLSRKKSREMENTAKKLKVPLVVTNDVYLLEKKDWDTHKLLRAIDLNSSLSLLKEEEYAPETSYLRSPEQMAALFPNHPEALYNTKRIADMCNVEFSFGNWIMPRIDVPMGYTPDSYLKILAGEGLWKNYGNTKSYDKAKSIQEMELNVIKKLGYSSYFLMVKDVRDWANNQFTMGYRRPKDCTILRGSAANSITFFNLGVSDLDPIKYNLYFQRFLNEDRASPPDADLDFGWDERDEVLEYVSKRFGEDRVAITCTTNHFRFRGAFREVAKVHGYSEEEITEIIESQNTKTNQITDSKLLDLWTLSESIQGKPRFLGQHPGGLLITNEPICHHVALERSGGGKNRIITQVDMHSGIDELGLIKFDLLGNGSLSVLRDALGQLFRQGQPDPKVWDLNKCFNDPKVNSIISAGRTRGIFYIESPAQTRLNKKCDARTFEEITITSSLVRPAGTGYTKTFVERHRDFKKGIVNWKFLHPSLESILNETHDVFAFQEDVTKVCHQVAGLSYKQADAIRKMMNSLHEGIIGEEKLMQTSMEFIEGCKKTSGLSYEQAFELWTRVSSFTGFSFCKSHSASYAQLSFQCTYLKAHFPAQFMSAVISNNHGFYSRDVYLDEARRWGIIISPIHINQSEIKYYGKSKWIQPGLMHIRNLSSKSMNQILYARLEGGRYKNLPDFLRRVSIGKKEIESLILVGAFNGFGLSQPELLFQLSGWYGKGQNLKPSLFQDTNFYDNKEFHPGLSDLTLMEKCLNELHILGYMLSGNILDILELHPSSKGSVSACEIYKYVGKRIKIFGRIVTERMHPVARNGKYMKFVTIEDKTENVDVIFWPDVYERFSDTLAMGGPYEIFGKVTEDYGTYSIEADFVKNVLWSPNLVDFELASKKLTPPNHTIKPYNEINPSFAA